MGVSNNRRALGTNEGLPNASRRAPSAVFMAGLLMATLILLSCDHSVVYAQTATTTTVAYQEDGFYLNSIHNTLTASHFHLDAIRAAVGGYGGGIDSLNERMERIEGHQEGIRDEIENIGWLALMIAALLASREIWRFLAERAP